MIIPLPAMAIGAHLAFTVADTVPQLNVEPSCRMSVMGTPQVTQSIDACLKDEQSARDQLVSEWSSFTAADRSKCIDLSTMGCQPTYTEVLTCLEMMRDARRIPSDSAGVSTTTGQRTR